MKKFLFISIASAFITALSLSGANISNIDMSKVVENPQMHILETRICDHLENNQCQTDQAILPNNNKGIFLSALLKDANEIDSIKIAWFYLEGDGLEIQSETTEINSEDNILYASLPPPPADWPRGIYEVQIEVIGSNPDSISKFFNIE